MILNLKDINGLVYSYICFNVVDKDTKLTDEGEYLLINGFWLHENYRKHFKEILRHLIFQLFIHQTTQKVQWVYWERDNGKIIKYHAYKFIKKFIEGETYGWRKTNDCAEHYATSDANS